MYNLIRVSKAKDLPLTKSTLYKWKHLKKYPEIFVKIGGALFVDTEALQKVIEEGRQAKNG
ncbi:MAG: hypothetical protein J7K85_04700 [Anaerolineaceae bacterium]|nr:hypothetical protein [Anaerolineaceae bacterium]